MPWSYSSQCISYLNCSISHSGAYIYVMLSYLFIFGRFGEIIIVFFLDLIRFSLRLEAACVSTFNHSISLLTASVIYSTTVFNLINCYLGLYYLYQFASADVWNLLISYIECGQWVVNWRNYSIKSWDLFSSNEEYALNHLFFDTSDICFVSLWKCFKPRRLHLTVELWIIALYLFQF